MIAEMVTAAAGDDDEDGGGLRRNRAENARMFTDGGWDRN